jgi:cytoskeletal protein CcmA (bactofilin family)
MAIFRKSEDPKAADPGPRPAAAVSPTPRGPSPPPSGAPCVIGARTRIVGEVTGDEDVLVDGYVEGKVRIQRDLRIGSGGVVKATVEARSVIVSGELNGDCNASGRVEIQATGRLTGNVRAPRLAIAEGAVFRGNSHMAGGGSEATGTAGSAKGKAAS